MRINSINNNTTPAFQALYFKTPKIQAKVQKNPTFPSFLQDSAIGWTIKKYNIVIESVSHSNKRFGYRACTDIMTKGDKILPAGLKLRTQYHYLNADHDFDWYILRDEPIFNKLSFANNIVKEDMMSSSIFAKFMSQTALPGILEKYKILIERAANNRIVYRVCENIKETKSGKLIPDGYFSANVVFPKNNVDTNLCWYAANLPDIIKMNSKILVTTDKVKQKFTNSEIKDLFLKYYEIQETADKYNIIVTNSCPADSLFHKNATIKFVVCTDIQQKGDKVLPAGYYSPELTFPKNHGYREILKNGKEHLDRLLEALQPGSTSQEKDIQKPLDELFV